MYRYARYHKAVMWAVFVFANILMVLLWVHQNGIEKKRSIETAMAEAEQNGLRIEGVLRNAASIATLSGHEFVHADHIHKLDPNLVEHKLIS